MKIHGLIDTQIGSNANISTYPCMDRHMVDEGKSIDVGTVAWVYFGIQTCVHN